MTDSIATFHLAATPAPATIVAMEDPQARLGALLTGLQQSAPAAEESGPDPDARFETQLASMRLGIATSLFFALRSKHAPTAAHSLRVALCCSAWAERLGLQEALRDRVEVAALLHDIGKIGIPDRILRKPGKLTVDEQLSMECCPQLSCEILHGCTGDRELLDIVRYAGSWYKSRRQGDGPSGAALPLGARMLAIADAFDSMTTDTVYRSAMSRERAIQELVDGSYSQFDPDLAIDFHRMLEQRPEMLQGVVVNRWLQMLQPASGDSLWGWAGQRSQQAVETVRRESLFYRQLLGNLKDGVVFTDAEGTITHWNGAMHQLTSIASEAIVGQSWNHQTVRLRQRDFHDGPPSCLVSDCLRNRAAVSRPMWMDQASGEPAPVQVQVSPVVGSEPGIHGTVVVIRDLSDQTDLEEQLQSLHHQTTRDPLTGVANRTHFDQTLQELVSIATRGGPGFSLIMCDIDHFKRVNDVHGHQAGDEALVSFASILSSHSRDGDLVARYGGEEFLLLTPNCDNATAVRRAELIRQTLERTPLASIGGESVTASFGVTEFQPGDSAETVVSRADRAMLKAKDNGRNRLIQLGSGNPVEPARSEPRKGWLGCFGSSQRPAVGEFDIITPVPIELAIEKLRGFIADHHAEIISVDESSLSLKLHSLCAVGGRRLADHRIALRAKLTLSERQPPTAAPMASCKTNVHVTLQPLRNRDRRGRELSECFAQVVASLQSYLMGELRPASRG
jgi:diguanylate cyclase (GGDEF)-like protein/PAS domain S-box-containing protein